MRYVIPLFVVSALLFVCGIGLTVIGARNVGGLAPAAAAAPVTAAPGPVATVRQVMLGIVQPAATAVFQSVQTHATEKGVEEIFPRTDEEWALLGSHAVSLAEAGRLLMTEPRALDRDSWITMAQAMIDASAATLKAVDAKSPEAVLNAGGDLTIACDNCHARYLRQ